MKYSTAVLAILAVAVLVTACGPSRSERIAAANVRKPATTIAYSATASVPSTYPHIASSKSTGPRPTMSRPAGSANPRIIPGSPGLQCVPFTRELSGIPIRGNAWTWWRQAKGKYHRSNRPVVGSVLVVSKTRRNKYGHLAVVTGIVNDREIILDHANWLNKGQIHLDTPARDVSARNDWSEVRFWYTPGNVLGKSTYPAEGFIYPTGTVATRN